MSKYIRSTAMFSTCRTWRYCLVRVWDDLNDKGVVFIGLNPSTADEDLDDPTIRRCVGFAKRLGAGRLVMLNMFAYRTTWPHLLVQAPDPVGPQNDQVIKFLAGGKNITIAAWGIHGRIQARDLQIKKLVPDLYCLGTTKNGDPRHPLYLRADAPLIKWEGRK